VVQRPKGLRFYHPRKLVENDVVECDVDAVRRGKRVEGGWGGRLGTKKQRTEGACGCSVDHVCSACRGTDARCDCHRTLIRYTPPNTLIQDGSRLEIFPQQGVFWPKLKRLKVKERG
jgi:hypothetical protein